MGTQILTTRASTRDPACARAPGACYHEQANALTTQLNQLANLDQTKLLTSLT